MWSTVFSQFLSVEAPICESFRIRILYYFTCFIFGIIVLAASKQATGWGEPLIAITPAQFTHEWSTAVTSYCSLGENLYLINMTTFMPLDFTARDPFWQFTYWPVLLSIQGLAFLGARALAGKLVQATGMKRLLSATLQAAPEDRSARRALSAEIARDLHCLITRQRHPGIMVARLTAITAYVVACIANIIYSNYLLSPTAPLKPWLSRMIQNGISEITNTNYTFFPLFLGCDYRHADIGQPQLFSLFCVVPVHKTYFTLEVFIHFGSALMAVCLILFDIMPMINKDRQNVRLHSVRELLFMRNILTNTEDLTLFVTKNLKRDGCWFLILVASRDKIVACEIAAEYYRICNPCAQIDSDLDISEEEA